MNPADEVAGKKEPTEGPSPGAAAGSDDREQPRVSLEELLGPSPQPKPVKRPASRGFARYLVAICIGVAATLAWQSYGDAIEQMIAARAPELGWSPQAKQMIATWTVGWMKPPASPEKIAPETVAPKAPPAPSVDPAQVQQIAQNLAALRQTVDQLVGGQDQMGREVARLEAAVAELIVKIPDDLPARPSVAPARKPTPVQPSSRATAPRQ
jgi:hypothetical protein